MVRVEFGALIVSKVRFSILIATVASDVRVSLCTCVTSAGKCEFEIVPTCINSNLN